MKEMLGYQVDAVTSALRMAPRTIERYVSKVYNIGEVKANTIGRAIQSVAMHPHVEFLIMEAVIKHPEKALSEFICICHHGGRPSQGGKKVDYIFIPGGYFCYFYIDKGR